MSGIFFDDAQIDAMVRDIGSIVRGRGVPIPDSLLSGADDGNDPGVENQRKVFSYAAATALIAAAALRITGPDSKEKLPLWASSIFDASGFLDCLAYEEEFPGVKPFLEAALMNSLAEDGLVPISTDAMLAVQEALWELGFC